MCNNFITTIFSNHGLENRFKYPFTVLVEFTISCLFIFIRGININWHKKKSPRRGIEPRSGTRQAPILTIKLSRIADFVVMNNLLSLHMDNRLSHQTAGKLRY